MPLVASGVHSERRVSAMQVFGDRGLSWQDSAESRMEPMQAQDRPDAVAGVRTPYCWGN